MNFDDVTAQPTYLSMGYPVARAKLHIYVVQWLDYECHVTFFDLLIGG